MKTQRLMNVSSANRKCRFTNIRQTAFVTVWFGSCGADGTAVIDEAVAEGKIRYIARDVFEGFYEEVLKAQVNPEVCKTSDLSVIYTPLNGTGNLHVREILKRIGIRDVTVVPEQELPDGNFPTCPYPNPEIRQRLNARLRFPKRKKRIYCLPPTPIVTVWALRCWTAANIN